MLEEFLAGLQPGEAEQVEDQLVQPVGLLVDPLQEPALTVSSWRAQSSRVSAYALIEASGRLQLVRGVGDEVLPHPFEPAEVGHVVEDEHGPGGRRAGQGRPSDREDPRLPAQGGSRRATRSRPDRRRDETGGASPRPPFCT